MTVLKPYATADELHADLILLVRWLAEDGHAPHEIADAVEKPWKYAADIEAARACAEVEMGAES